MWRIGVLMYLAADDGAPTAVITVQGVVSFGIGVAPHLNGVLPPSAPADEAAARQNQAGKASTGDRPRDTDSNIEIELRKQNIRIGEEAIWLGYCRDIYIPEPQIIADITEETLAISRPTDGAAGKESRAK
jgi:hypothetical protein